MIFLIRKQRYTTCLVYFGIPFLFSTNQVTYFTKISLKIHNFHLSLANLNEGEFSHSALVSFNEYNQKKYKEVRHLSVGEPLSWLQSFHEKEMIFSSNIIFVHSVACLPKVISERGCGGNYQIIKNTEIFAPFQWGLKLRSLVYEAVVKPFRPWDFNLRISLKYKQC